jgi:hypothetical protein
MIACVEVSSAIRVSNIIILRSIIGKEAEAAAAKLSAREEAGGIMAARDNMVQVLVRKMMALYLHERVAIHLQRPLQRRRTNYIIG